MDIKELINDLSFDTFQALRVEVLKRHELHAAQIAGIIQYLMIEKPDICSSIESEEKDEFCVNSLAQTFHGIPEEIILRAIIRYREVKDMNQTPNTGEGQ